MIKKSLAVFLNLLFIFFFSVSLCRASIADEFPRGDIGDFFDMTTWSHKEQLVKESLKEKTTVGTSYPYEIVFKHLYTSIKKDGSLSQYCDFAFRINTASAKTNLGEQAFPFFASRDGVEIIAASVYLADGREIKTDSSLAQVKDPFGGLVYSDLKVKTLSLKGLEEGSILRVFLKKTHVPDVTKGFIFETADFDNYVPTREQVYIFRIEAGTPIEKKIRVQDGFMKSCLSRSYNAKNGDLIEIYHMAKSDAVSSEPSSIPPLEFCNRIFLYSPNTWDAIGKWYFKLATPKVDDSKDLTEKALQLTANLTETADKIKALYNYVKGIRYVAVLLNEHEMIPHEASVTFQNGYGDCKDKTTLLIAMLKTVGIQAHMALVNTGYLISQDPVSPLIFNHAIVAIPQNDKTYSFLDPTGVYTPYGLLPFCLQNRNALVVKENSGELVLIPPPSAEKNRVSEHININLRTAQQAILTNIFDMISPDGYYYMLSSLPEKTIKEAFQQIMAERYKEFEILVVKREPADSLGILRGKEEFKIGDFTKRMGNSYTFNPLEGADSIGNKQIFSIPNRKTDIELESPCLLTAEVIVKIPNALMLDYFPKNKFIKEKFGEYSYRSQLKTLSDGKELAIKRSFRLDAKRVSIKEYDEFKKFYQTCIRQDEEFIVLKDGSKDNVDVKDGEN